MSNNTFEKQTFNQKIIKLEQRLKEIDENHAKQKT